MFIDQNIKNIFYKSLPYYSVYGFIPILFLNNFYPSTIFILPFILFGILPIIEFYSKDTESTDEKTDIDGYYDLPVFLWTFAQIGFLFYFFFHLNHLGLYKLIFFSINVGLITGGIGINVAHELIHKKSMEKTLGKILLCSVLYGHFYIEHIWGHHRNVGTYKDAATARLGENIYQFIYRSMTESFKNALFIGSKYKKINSVYIFLIAEFIYLISVLIFTGYYGLIFLIVFSFTSMVMLESVNYIEHYGLTRKENTIVNYNHSWNSDKSITNYLTFKLQRHSDHHMNHYKKYYTLENIDISPKLPTGYLGCLVLAYIPPIWFKYMNSKIYWYNKKYF